MSILKKVRANINIYIRNKESTFIFLKIGINFYSIIMSILKKVRANINIYIRNKESTLFILKKIRKLYNRRYWRLYLLCS